MKIDVEYLKDRFKASYVDTAVDRYHEMLDKYGAMVKTFGEDKVLEEFRGVRMGHRWSLYGYNRFNGLYEITGIERRRDGTVEATLQKVLKTKVSSSRRHTKYLDLVELMNHPDNNSFEPYNEIIDELWTKVERDNG